MHIVGNLVESFRDLADLSRNLMYYNERKIPAEILQKVRPKILESFTQYSTLFDFYPAPDHSVSGKRL